nr:hypothetical protein [Tanacetum cinerariifolium]
MSFDDLYNNFKIVEQEVKETTNSSSISSSYNMAFMSSPSSTNEVNNAYGVSTANTQVSPTRTQVNTASTQVSTANLSDANVYAFLASQPNGSQLVHEDLVEIHEDDLKEMDLNPSRAVLIPVPVILVLWLSALSCKVSQLMVVETLHLRLVISSCVTPIDSDLSTSFLEKISCSHAQQC